MNKLLVRLLVVLTIAATVPTLVAAPAGATPTNDAFADGQVLTSGLPLAIEVTNLDATKEPGEPDHAGQPGGSSVWFTWTADASGPVEVDTCRSGLRSLLAVYTGDAVDALTPVADDAGSCDGASRVVFDASADTTYRIALDGVNGQEVRSLTLRLHAHVPPVNDDLADAEVLRGPLPIAATGSNIDATHEEGEPAHAGDEGGGSVWFSWTPEESGLVVIRTCGSDFNTLLAVYTGGAVNELTPIVGNDNTSDCQQDGGPSKVQLTVNAGTTYLIAVDGTFSRMGSINLELRAANRPGNDDFADAEQLDGALPVSTTGSTLEATAEPGESQHGGTSGGTSVWYRWTPEASGNVAVETCDSAVGATIGVYTGDAVDALAPVVAGAWTKGCGPGFAGAQVAVFGAQAGVEYRIAVDGSFGSAGDIGLLIRPAARPANDAFADAQAITGSLPVDAHGTNFDATKEPGEPNHADNRGGASIWFTWTPAESARVSIDTCAGYVDSLLAVYTGEAVDALTLVASNRTASGCTHARVVIDAVAGTTYRIAVDGFSRDTDQVVVALRPAAIVANDAFADAQDLRGALPIIVTGSSLQASREAGEPNHADTTGGASIWYRWTPTTTGVAVIETCESSFDTLLGVYTGDAVSALTPIANNDDVRDCTGSNRSNSRVRINAVAGTTYRIAVDGYRGASGTVRLAIRPTNPPPNDAFADAAPITGALPIGFEGTTKDATREPGEPNHAGVVGTASIWYRWTPATTTKAVVDGCGSELRGLLAVYTGTTIARLTPVASDSDQCGSRRAVWTAYAGETYWIAIDGAGGTTGRALLSLRTVPTNDDFADAQPLTDPLPLRLAGDNDGASRELGEPRHAGSTNDQSVWYRWTAPSAQPVVIDLCESGPYDTSLGVYTGDVLTALTEVVSNDDGCQLRSRAVLRPIAGQSYAIAVDGGGTFVLELRVAHPPANDDLGQAIAIGGVLPIVVTGANVEATREASEPDHAGVPASSSVWYRWTPITSEPVVIDGCETSFDSVLAVYTGGARDELTEVASNLEGCNWGVGNFLRLDVIAGETYWLAIDGVNGSMGELTLALRVPPANDHLADAQLVRSSTEGTTVDASYEDDEPSHGGRGASVWYRWTAPSADVVAIDVCGDVSTAAYAGSELADLGEPAYGWPAASDQCEVRTVRRIVLTPEAGHTYLLAVDARFESGAFRLTIGPAPTTPHDDFVEAQVLGGTLPLTIAGTNDGATKEGGEPDHARFVGGSSVWFAWTPTVSGAVIIETCGTPDLDTVLGVYTGSAVDALREVASNDDGCGWASRVSIAATAGTTYRIAVDSLFGDSGPFALTIRAGGGTRPANDAFASAEVVQGSLPISVTGSNVNATRETAEPFHNAIGGASVWWAWTPDRSGQVVIDACGNGFDSLLAVYTGAAVHALTRVAVNVDTFACDGGRVIFDVVAGTTYRIVVDGENRSEGAITLLVREATPPANDDFAGAAELSATLPINANGTNVDASNEPGEHDHGRSNGDASVWYRWTPATSGLVALETCGSALDTSLAVYRGDVVADLEWIGSNDDGCHPGSRVVIPVTAGETYFIAIDGMMGATGAFTLHIRTASPPANDHLADAQVLDPVLPTQVRGSNVDATQEPAERDHGSTNFGTASVWFRWTPTVSQTVVVETCGTFATQVEVYRGTVFPLDSVADATATCPAALRFRALAGTTYRIAVDGAGGGVGPFTLAVRAVPVNDDVNRAVELRRSPAHLRTSNVDASVEPGEPRHAGRPGGASLWYRWTAPSSGRVTIDTCGSAIDTVVGVYTGGSVNRLTEVARNDDHCGRASRVRFTVTTGRTYLFAIDGANGATGEIRLTVHA